MSRSATKILRYTISKGKLLIIFQSGSVWYPNKEEVDNIVDSLDKMNEIRNRTEELSSLLETRSNG